MPNWGQVIFQSANEMNQNLLIKQRIAELQGQLDAEKAWWEKKRAGIQSDFMKELDDGAQPADPTATARKNGSSDEDGVLVEADGPAQAQGGGGKKKKGKK